MEARPKTPEVQRIINGQELAPHGAPGTPIASLLSAADDHWEYQPLDLAADVDDTNSGFTELRCHGVSGPLPGAVLGFPEDLVTQVWGNAYSGFWRRWMLGPTRDVPGEHRREAFCWGGLTSRASIQALWLLLLPFSLVNIAHWMLLPYRRNGAAARSAVVLLRLLALSLTGTLLLSGAEVTMDLGAWQCGAAAVCRPKLLPFGLMNAEGGWPGLRLGAAALVLGTVLLLLWRAGMQRYAPLEGTNAPEPTVPIHQAKPPGRRTERTKDNQPVLSHPQFWAVDLSTRWLRGLHALLWCAGTGALLAGVLASNAAQGSAARGVGIGLAIANLAVVAGVVVAVLPQWFGRGGTGPTTTRWLRWLVPVGPVLLAGTIAATVGLLPGSADRGGVRLPWLQGAFEALTVAQIAVLVLLGCCVGGLAAGFRRMNRGMPAHYRPMLGGWLSVVVAFLSWFVALAFSAGLGLLAAGRWGTAVTAPGSPTSKTLDLLVPPTYQWIEVAAVTTAAALALGVIVIGVTRLLPIRRSATEIAAQPRPLPREDSPDQWRPGRQSASYPALSPDPKAKARAAARIERLAQSTQLIPVLLAVAMATVIAVAVAAIWHFFATGRHSWFPAIGWLERTSSVGTWLATTGTGALIALSYAAYRNQQTRRTVGILWDVTTFWPRANHPLTPACTAERAVPQLAERIEQLTQGPGDSLVLSAHSQGTVLGLAAMLRLCAVPDTDQPQDEDPLKKLALLTFGSPLCRLYARCFPAYFSPEVLGATYADIGARWVNLWAETDPIGGPIGVTGQQPEAVHAWVPCKADDQMTPDPLTLGTDFRTGQQVGVCDHSGYVQRPAFEEAVRLLRQEIGAGPPGALAVGSPDSDVPTEGEPATD